MSITISVAQPTYKLLHDMECLSRDYYDAATGVPEYNFNAKLFVDLGAADALVLIAAHDDNKLVGYCYYMMMSHPHHVTWKLGYGGIATRTEYRGQGIASRMQEIAEPLLKLHGVSRIILCERVKLGADPLYPKLGFELEERAYKKDL